MTKGIYTEPPEKWEGSFADSQERGETPSSSYLDVIESDFPPERRDKAQAEESWWWGISAAAKHAEGVEFSLH